MTLTGRARRYIDAVCRRPARATAWLALACVPLLALALSFVRNIDPGPRTIEPRGSQAARAQTEIAERRGQRAHLAVLARSPNATANRRFIVALAARLQAKNVPEILSIQADFTAERAWRERRMPLLLPAATFDRIADALDSALQSTRAAAAAPEVKVTPITGAQTSPAERWTELEALLAREAERHARFPSGFFETPGGQTVVALVWLKAAEINLGAAERVLTLVGDEARTLAAEFPPGLDVAITGGVAELLARRDAIADDLQRSFLLALAALALLVLVAFRSGRALAAVLLALAPGLLLTFAAAALLAGHLHGATAPLGALALAIGAPPALLLVALHRRRPSEHGASDAIASVVKQLAHPAAAVAAAVAAGGVALALARLRGLASLGWLLAMASAAALVSVLIAGPIALALCAPPRKGGARRVPRRGVSLRPRPARVLVGALALGLAAAAFVGVRTLRAPSSHAIVPTELTAAAPGHGEDALAAVFGGGLDPIVVLLRAPEDRGPALRALGGAIAGGLAPAITGWETIEDHRPPLDEQHRRLERLAKLGRAYAAVPPGTIPASARPWADLWLDPRAHELIHDAEIPPGLLAGLRELSGVTERTILLYPAPRLAAPAAMATAEHLARVPLPAGAVVGGAFLADAENIRRLPRETSRVGLVAIVLVSVALMPFFWHRGPGRRGLPGYLALLFSVMPAALAAEALLVALGARIDVASFAALPLVVGLGAAHAVVRLVPPEEPGGDPDASSSSARAVLTFASSFAAAIAVILAPSGAHRGFGWALLVGLLVVAAAVLTVLPVLARAVPAMAAARAPG